MGKYAVLLLPFFIVGLVILEPLVSKSSTDSATENSALSPINDKIQIQSAEFLSQNCPAAALYSTSNSQTVEPQVIKVLITAYSSSPEETDSTPLITASGSRVRNGVVAANFLPFGTKIRLPEIFGDAIFTVEDRLSEKNNDRIDVWFPSKQQAVEFGYKITEAEIL